MRMLLVLLILGFSPMPAAAASPGTPIIEWNETLLRVAENEDGFLTLKGLRAAAMMHLAMHDAINRITGEFATFVPGGPVADVEPLAAATWSAYRVAASQYPGEEARFAALRDRWLDSLPSAGGRELGVAVADAVLAARKGDGWDKEAEYTWHPMAPGVYAEFDEHSGTPEGFVFGAGWARAQGFALSSPDQFRAPPPPAIDSDGYTQAFDEVKSLGRFQSIERTPDQAHLALWWKDFVENSHNRLARDLVRGADPGLAKTARLFALLNMSVFDAYISSFDNKFFYNHWRPYTAIRWASHDGNDNTLAEEGWNNLHRHTYAFPSYPSAHGTACAAAMTAIADAYSDTRSFTMSTPMVDISGPFSGKIEMQPPTRSFDSFLDAAAECAASRVYLGIHFRYDSDAGFDLGRQVGQNVVDELLVER